MEYDFPKTFNLEFIAGRDFQLGNLNDSNSLILNEAAIQALNKPTGDVMGTTVKDTRDTNRLYRVIGVVKNFPFRSMHQPIEPLVLNPHLDQIDKIAYIKLPVGKFQEKIADIEKKWKASFPGAGFDHWFVSDEFNRMYQVETTISSLAKIFAVLAILITDIGRIQSGLLHGRTTHQGNRDQKSAWSRRQTGGCLICICLYQNIYCSQPDRYSGVLVFCEQMAAGICISDFDQSDDFYLQPAGIINGYLADGEL